MALRETKLSVSEDERSWSGIGRGDVLPYLGILVTLGIWWAVTSVATGVLSNFAPVGAFASLFDLLTTAEFYRNHISASLIRFGFALLLSVVVGVPLGIALGYFEVVERLSTVAFQFIRMISPVAWFPVALLVFESGGHAAPIFVMFLAGVWPLMFNTAHGISTIDRAWIDVALSLGGNTPRIIRKVVIPAAIPSMLSGLRLSIGILWIMLVPAEILGVSSGLGYYVLNARYEFNYADIPAVMMIIGLIGFGLDVAVRKLMKRWSWQ